MAEMTTTFPLTHITPPLHPITKTAIRTSAAMAVHAWMSIRDTAAPWISITPDAPRMVARYDPGSYVIPDEIYGTTGMTALVLDDRSALVARQTGDVLEVMPQIFRLDEDAILHDSGAAEKTKRRIRAALESFAPVFEREVFVGQPQGRPPQEATAAGDAASLGLARLPRTGEVFCPHWLPQTWFSESERAALRSWARDVGEWLMGGIALAARCEIVMTQMAAEHIDTSKILIIVKCKDGSELLIVGPGPDGPGKTWSSLPVPDSRRKSRSTGAFLRSIDIASATERLAMNSEKPSRHRNLELRKRFGPVPDPDRLRRPQ